MSQQGNAQAKEAFINAAKEGDLANVKLAVEKHKLDPNCKYVSAGGICQIDVADNDVVGERCAWGSVVAPPVLCSCFAT